MACARNRRLAELSNRLEARRGRLQRLAEFYRLLDRTERLAGLSSDMVFRKIDEDALAACRAALGQLHITEGDMHWWLRLPVEDLQPEQRARLETDASVALGLTAVWQAKKGVMTPGERSAHFRSGREYLKQIQAICLAPATAKRLQQRRFFRPCVV